MTAVSIIIPAHDEAAYIGPCLEALLGSGPIPGPLRIIVVANACTDDTAAIARGFTVGVEALGWQLDVRETATPGKLHALDLAEAGLGDDIRVYLDTDVRVSPDLLSQLVKALDRPPAAYASGTPQVEPPPGGFLRAYTRFWTRLPFVARGVPGFGIFAVNSAGRARWGGFPDIISDDTFVRLQFAPSERIAVAANYRWPMVAGLANLIRVRRRQDAGVAEISRHFPQLMANSGARPSGAALARLALRDPFGFAAYALVSLAVRLPLLRSSERWVRGR